MPPPAHGLASRLIAGPTLRTQSDRRLVTLVREGYETAFEEIVRRYGRQLGRYAAAIVGGRSEDVTQDAFSKALLALRRDDGEIELRPWLYRIVRNTALNDLRDRPAAAAELAGAIAAGSNPAEAVEQREELTELMGRLQALPEAQRAAIVMRELEGLSHEEIAAALGMSGGAARQAIYRARQALRDGAGMLVPLPLLRILLTDGPAVAEAAGGAAGIAGAGVAVKATAATVLVAGTIGTGVALQETRDTRGPEASARAATQRAEPGETAGPISPVISSSGGDSGGRSGSDSGPSSSSGKGSGDADSDDERRGAEDERDDDHSGRDDSSGHSGEGSGHSGEDRSGSSGSGSSGDDHADDDSGTTVDDSEDRSGPGDGSGGGGSGTSGGSLSSGSSGSGSSGSGGSYSSGTGSSGASGSGSSDSGSSGGFSGSDLDSDAQYELEEVDDDD